ncbi:MAG TPA: hypothetical protein VFR79_04790 [Nitrospira sp.]|nr:hypothetical protein [Nitrospira sp.]
MKPIWFVALGVMLCAGCGGAPALENLLQTKNGPLGYLYDSEKVSEKQTGTVRIGSVIVEDVLPQTTSVTEQSGFMLPLLVVNVWKYDYHSQLGHSQLTNDYKTFIKDSFVEELKRSGKFSYVDDQSAMEIDLKIKTISMTAPIRKTGNVIFLLYAVSFSQSYYAGPAEALITADAVLKKDGTEVFTQQFTGVGKTGVLQGRNLDIADFTTAMIEALSLSVKNLHENIVREINKI